MGPYDIPFGDSVKVVIAQVYGNISPEKAFEVGQAWLNDDAHFGNDDLSTNHLPPQYLAHPELYEADDKSELSKFVLIKLDPSKLALVRFVNLSVAIFKSEYEKSVL